MVETQMAPLDARYTWASHDFTRTPYWAFTDQEIFDQEMERVFRGPTWNYLALIPEVANPGDFVTCFVGTTPVVVQRGKDGNIHAYVNRCAHRGMQVVRELRGNRMLHNCLYHQWTYDTAGKVVGVAMQRGDRGVGGMPADFRKEDHAMRPLRVAVLNNVIFGTFSDETPPIEEYFGRAVCDRIAATVGRPIEVTGYHRHVLKANWKLFSENSRDAYHAPMLHPFLPTFGLMRPNDRGSCQLGGRGFHSVISIWNDAPDAKSQRGSQQKGSVKLEDISLVQGFPEHEDGLSLNIISMFPSGLFTCVGNTLSIRQIRPKAPDEVELIYTHFGYVDDTSEQRAMRRKQSNLFGPAGYVAIEDVEALELLQAAIGKGEDHTHSLIEMGGREAANSDHVMSEAPIRGFWKGYCDIMQIPVPAA